MCNYRKQNYERIRFFLQFKEQIMCLDLKASLKANKI